MYDDEPFCNPMAPVDESEDKSSNASIHKHNLSNSDFRKLMMTPAANQVDSTLVFGAKQHAAASVRGHRRQLIANEDFKKPGVASSSDDKKKNKKKFYQQKKDDDEENLLAELAKKYRDRAKERREHIEEQDDHQTATSSYNAVANMSGEDAAERRKQLIEESKYLGGDMEHTHLVKGLDYALLQKVKTEIEFERDQETLRMVEKNLANKAEQEEGSDNDVELDAEDEWKIKSRLASNLMTVLFETNLPEKNDYFLPGRFAYVFDLENDCPTDAFTSVIRSKADCPNWESHNALSTNEIVLNKLIEIFEEIREQGGKRRKKQKTSLQLDQMNEKMKSSLINHSNKLSAGNSLNDSVRSRRSHSVEAETRDLTSVYDQDLNFDVIKQATSKVKVENDLDIYDDLENDYVLPHQKAEQNKTSSHSRSDSNYSSSRRDDRHDRSYHSSRREKESGSRRRSVSSSSSSDDERYSRHNRRPITPDYHRRDKYHRDDYRREERHYSSSSSSRKRRY